MSENWTSVKEQYPPLWKKVLYRFSLSDRDSEAIASRRLFDTWKFESGLTTCIHTCNVWRPLDKEKLNERNNFKS